MSQVVGFVVLEGGKEFTGEMASVDRRALALGGGNAAPIRIIPAAAAPDKNHQKAGGNGIRWFKTLGASDVSSLDIIDPASADRSDLSEEIETAKIIFILGGFPRHLAETLAGSRAWQAISTALRKGAVLTGSSAGAMVLCEHYFDPVSGKIRKGLNLVPGAVVLPHHDTFGKTWAQHLAESLPGSVLLGIDEETGLMNDGPAGEWTVYGKGAVTVYELEEQAVFRHGQRCILPITVQYFL